MPRLILLRHGQSLWNLENRFTGWTDVDLSDRGRDEAREAARRLADASVLPRYCFTSYLRRAVHTLDIVLDSLGLVWLPVVKDWHLNERHYGALQGLNKDETAKKYGDRQVHIWRRSFDAEPPALTRDDERWPGHDARYADLAESELPLTESLKSTISRVYPSWTELIEPALRLYGTVIVAAHGNSLRALAKILLKISDNDIADLEIPTGAPWLFDFDSHLDVTSNRYL